MPYNEILLHVESPPATGFLYSGYEAPQLAAEYFTENHIY